MIKKRKQQEILGLSIKQEEFKMLFFNVPFRSSCNQLGIRDLCTHL